MDSSYGHRPFRWLIFPAVLVVAFAAIAIGASFYFRSAPPQVFWWPWAPFGWFFFIPLFFAGFFVLRFFFWGWWGGRGWYYHGDTATQVLRERFARGEITKEQFEQMRKDLAQA